MTIFSPTGYSVQMPGGFLITADGEDRRPRRIKTLKQALVVAKEIVQGRPGETVTIAKIHMTIRRA